MVRGKGAEPTLSSAVGDGNVATSWECWRVQSVSGKTLGAYRPWHRTEGDLQRGEELNGRIQCVLARVLAPRIILPLPRSQVSSWRSRYWSSDERVAVSSFRLSDQGLGIAEMG